jgi:hypothetical protein
MYISTFFIRHYGCYCKACGYKTELSPSEDGGCKEWMMASQGESGAQNASKMVEGE